MSVTKTRKTQHSQRAEPSLLWFGLCPETRVATGSREILLPSMRVSSSRAEPSRPANGAQHKRGEYGGSDPPFRALGVPRRGGECAAACAPHPPPPGGRSLFSDPCGKAERPIQEASALMPRDSSDWMPKASMTSAGASISSSGPCMSRAWAKSSSVSAVKIRAPMAATIRSSTDWG